MGLRTIPAATLPAMTGLQPETATAIRRSHLAAQLGCSRSRVVLLVERGFLHLNPDGWIDCEELNRAMLAHPEMFEHRSTRKPLRRVGERSPVHKERSEVAKWNHVQLDMANGGFDWPMEAWRGIFPILIEVAMSHGIELPANPNRGEPI